MIEPNPVALKILASIIPDAFEDFNTIITAAPRLNIPSKKAKIIPSRLSRASISIWRFSIDKRCSTCISVIFNILSADPFSVFSYPSNESGGGIGPLNCRMPIAITFSIKPSSLFSSTDIDSFFGTNCSCVLFCCFFDRFSDNSPISS